ncbi:hypothetical protein M513_10567 [Trichuris suis]|uniref:Major sperm protein n=1 Tax=Trichuris suis TaxID=68888 RepID=A0A085LUB0_9BILA|nr:hypothetical protein M513_10567 [Trichuris suis]
MSSDGLEQALMTAAGQMKLTPKDQITFTGPFDQIKVVDLNMLNESKFRLAYKFRCTRPEGLKFRPGYGMVRPGKERIVKVRCLPITGNPPAKDRCTLVVVALSDDQKPAKGTKFWKDPDNPVKEMARYSIEVNCVWLTMIVQSTFGLSWLLPGLLLVAWIDPTSRLAEGTNEAVEVLTKCNELLNAKTSSWKVRMFWRQLLRLCAMANRYFDNHLIVLFCGSTKRYPVCKKVDEMLRQRISNISSEGRPAYIKTDNFAFGEDFSVHHFPALTYAVAGRLFHFTDIWSEEAVDRWMSQMLTSSVRLVDSTNFEEVRQRYATSVVLLYSQENELCAAYAGKWWDYVAKSVYDRKDIDFFKLECSGVNGFFVEQRFSIDCTTPCPQVVLVANNHIKMFPLSIYSRGAAAQIRHFIETEITNPEGWQELMAEPSDLEYLVFEMELALASRMQRPLYIVTGFTGGFGVIVLAVSIFWGLKGNAFTVPLRPVLPK